MQFPLWHSEIDRGQRAGSHLLPKLGLSRRTVNGFSLLCELEYPGKLRGDRLDHFLGGFRTEFFLCFH